VLPDGTFRRTRSDPARDFTSPVGWHEPYDFVGTAAAGTAVGNRRTDKEHHLSDLVFVKHADSPVWTAKAAPRVQTKSRSPRERPRWLSADKSAPKGLALCRLDIVDGKLAGAAILRRVEGNLLAFDEAAHARAFKRGGMDEHVLAAVARQDEAEAF